MKGKWVICRHLESVKELKKAEEYLNRIGAPYEVKQLNDNVFSIHACFEGFKDPRKEQINFQKHIYKDWVY